MNDHRVAFDTYLQAAHECVGWLVSLQLVIDRNVPLFFYTTQQEDIKAAIEAILERRVDALGAIGMACRRRVRSAFKNPQRFDHGRHAFVDAVRVLLIVATICEYAHLALVPYVDAA